MEEEGRVTERGERRANVFGSGVSVGPVGGKLIRSVGWSITQNRKIPHLRRL